MAGALEISLKFTLSEFPIDKYVRLEKLGQGAYGAVDLYEQRRDDVNDELLPANESVLPNFIAVKTFETEHYFEIEKNNLNIVSSDGQDHPNLVKVYGWCELPNKIFGIVMERYDKNLKDFIREQNLLGKSIDLDLTKKILFQLANSLKYLCEKNIVHRDMKPENILLRHIDKRLEVALTDFGVSREIPETEMSNMTYKGTRLWMAPEVKECRSKYGHPSDVFSFGLIAMYLKTGARPINRDNSGN